MVSTHQSIVMRKKSIVLFSTIIISMFLSTALAKPAKGVSDMIDLRAKVRDVTSTTVTVVIDNTEEVITIPQDTVFPGLYTLKKNDRVQVSHIMDVTGEGYYVISGFVRSPAIIWLFICFIALILLLYRKKGIASIGNLVLLLCSILFIMVPLILRGYSPVLVTTVVGTIALSSSVFISYGNTKKSLATIVSMLLSVLIVGILSSLAISFATLTGFNSEEASILLGLGYDKLNMHSLLLAAMIIGALGVLDDLIISQISAVEELQHANPSLTKKELFAAAMRIGKDHSTAVINTLALAYTGAAFPLVILLYIGESPFDSISNTLNNEVVATEIVRLLSGTMGVILSIPIATWIGVTILQGNKKR